jgi:hypothetical protein
VLRSTSRWIIGSWGRPWRVCIGELDILIRWQRDPNFYLEQTLTPVAEALTVPGAYNETESREILSRLNNIPAILEEAQKNLVSPPAPFAKMTIDSLAGIRPKLEQMAKALPPETTIPATERLASAERAATSLEAYGGWLQKTLPTLPAQSAIGRENYTWFLRNVASCRTRRKHWWRVPSRNGDAQSHSKG